MRTARPSGWRWQGGQIITEWRLYLWDDADAVNILKTVEDAVFPALNINDSYDLPRVMSKELVPKSEARVVITIREA